MVLVMESDGSLTPSRSQSSFARNYNEGIGQSSASDGIAIFGEVEAEQEGVQVAALARPTPLPRADVLSGIQTMGGATEAMAMLSTSGVGCSCAPAISIRCGR